MKLTTEKRLSLLLWFIAFHSLIVGIALIVMPAELIGFLGFNTNLERFFPSQGGVFHIAMSFAYALPAVNDDKYKHFIFFSIFVKLIATLFLIIYYFFVDAILLVLISGVTDFGMAAAIYLFFVLNKKSIKKEELYA